MAAAGSLVIRSLTGADMTTVQDMWVAAWNAAYPAIDFAARRDWLSQHIADLEQDGSLPFVAVIDGGVAGLLVIDPNTGYLDQITVAITHQRGGVGHALLLQAAKVATEDITLDVNQDNAAAIAFYKKHKFEITGSGKNAQSGAATYKMTWKP